MVTSLAAKIADPGGSKKTKPAFIVGFMGSGKTCAGRLLALVCKLPFVDIDAELETFFGEPISDIFFDGREKDFRKAESALIARHASSGIFSIIATGGGACSNPATLRAMHDNGIVFWLDAPWPVLLPRIQGDPRRPMLAGDPEALYNSRRAHYEACAHYRVDASANPEKIVAELAKLLCF